MANNTQNSKFNNVLITISILIIVLLFCINNITKSNLICSTYSGCKVIELNIFGQTVKEKKVNLDSISRFYVSSAFDIYHVWRYFQASSGDQAYIQRKQILKYHIYALTKDGEKQKFFSASSRNKYKAEEIANELNYFLNSSDKNINIKY